MGLPRAKFESIGKYQITAVIGRGGMGTVYRGVDPVIGRPVAIKVLTTALDSDPELLARFYREAQYTGGLQHPNIVTVYELGDQDGLPYLVMEWLEGESLESVISSQRQMAMGAKMGVIVQVCNGIAFAHQRHIVHRDIKPANIVVLKNGTAKIVDFGIAHVGGNRLTRTGEIVGSIDYMSPEQLNGSVEVDFRTDIYSTGVVLFQLLTGSLPFRGKDTGSTIRKIFQDPVPPLRNLLAEYPAELDEIMQRALAKDREQRYSSAEDFSFELSRLEQGLKGDMLASYLREATAAARTGEYEVAKQQLVEALRIDSQNFQAAQLLREVQKNLELRNRREDVRLLRVKAELALGENRYDTALRYLQQGLQLEKDDTELLGLRDVVLRKQAAAAKATEILQYAEAQYSQGDFESAAKNVSEALALDVGNTAARGLKARIDASLDERYRAVKNRRTAMAVNAVERAMADGRMFLALQQPAQAAEALRTATQDSALVPAELKERYDGFFREVQSWLDGGKDEFGAWAATSLGFPASGRVPPTPLDAGLAVAPGPALLSPQTARESVDNGVTAPLSTVEDADSATSEPTGPEDLTEFLPPRHSGVSRVAMWVGVALVCALVVLFALDPSGMTGRFESLMPLASSRSQTQDGHPAGSYVEINAVPWGTVKSITDGNGEVLRTLDEVTPLRLALAAGTYNVTIAGPDGSEKRGHFEVPRAGSGSCVVVFQKPDVNTIIQHH